MIDSLLNSAVPGISKDYTYVYCASLVLSILIFSMRLSPVLAQTS